MIQKANCSLPDVHAWGRYKARYLLHGFLEILEILEIFSYI
jgi:hypothetical protein